MEKLILRSFAVIILLILTACSSSDDVTEAPGIDGNTLISGNFTQNDSTKIEGSGTIRFTNPLPILSSRSLSLKASLDSTIAMSSVAAIFYTPNAIIPTTEGIVVTFSRSGASINAQVSFNGNAAAVKSSKVSFYFPTALDLIIEVHNVQNKARVLIWRRNTVEYAAATADIDTDRADDFEGTLPTQKGTGAYVGLILQNATVTGARVEAQKVLD